MRIDLRLLRLDIRHLQRFPRGSKQSTQEILPRHLGFATVILVAVDLVLRAGRASIDFPERESFHTTAQTILGSDWSDSLLVNVCGSRFEDHRVRDRVPLLCLRRLYVRFGSDVRRTGIISPRARRTLPYTFAGRVLTTWFYPGAGMGYIFMVCLFAALVITMYITELYYSMSLQLIMNRTSIQYIGYLLLCYLAIYAESLD